MPLFSGAPRAARVRRRLALTVMVALLPLTAAAQPLSLSEALTRAAGQDPTRPTADARIQAAEANARQAGVKPNPSIGLDIENFAGTGDRDLADRTETTLYWQQTLERGGKREARLGAARAEVSVARLRGQVRALDHLAAVQALWVDAAVAQEAIGIAEVRLTAAQRLERETARRVAAARDPLFAGERARTAVAQARIALDHARDNARNARAALAAYLGQPDVEIDSGGLGVLGGGGAADAPAGLEPVDLRILEAERDAALARVRVEEARAVQDPTLRAGVRHFREGGDVAVVVGGSIPLGRNDTNAGAIDRARAERLAAEAEIAFARSEREREIARLAARRAATAAEVRRIDAEVTPSAQRAVELVRDGFSRGGGAFTFLEVAEAQRAETDAQARRLDLLKSFHLDGVRLDRLTGRHAALIAIAETR
jgi:outer membrane protein, heavy metal efflux system